jgi:hypothetical protein
MHILSIVSGGIVNDEEEFVTCRVLSKRSTNCPTLKAETVVYIQWVLEYSRYMDGVRGHGRMLHRAHLP